MNAGSVHPPGVQKEAELLRPTPTTAADQGALAVVAPGASRLAAAAAVPRRCRGRQSGLEDEQGMPRSGASEEPAVHVPEHLHRHLLHPHRLVAPELPLQIAHVDQDDAVDADPHLRVLVP